ncbi:hypothetical protein ACLOJK_034319, partial [Asimina triloba]
QINTVVQQQAAPLLVARPIIQHRPSLNGKPKSEPTLSISKYRAAPSSTMISGRRQRPKHTHQMATSSAKIQQPVRSWQRGPSNQKSAIRH